MAWPPTPSSGYQATSTVVWGTDGVFSTYIVTSMRNAVTGEEILIQNGTGLTVIQILLNDGYQVDISVIDVGQGPPAFGSVASVSGPFYAGNYRVVATSEDAARKREGEISFTAKKFTLIS